MTSSQREPGINKKRSIIFRLANDPQGTVQSLFKSSGTKDKHNSANGTSESRESGSTWATHSHNSVAGSEAPDSPVSSMPASPTSTKKNKLGFLAKKASFASLKRTTSEPAILQVAAAAEKRGNAPKSHSSSFFKAHFTDSKHQRNSDEGYEGSAADLGVSSTSGSGSTADGHDEMTQSHSKGIPVIKQAYGGMVGAPIQSQIRRERSYSQLSSHDSRSRTFRRSFSANSIKFTDLEVAPNSFTKIRLIGKGDVGKVYLVEKKSNGKLYAMKGWNIMLLAHCTFINTETMSLVLSKREMIKRNKIKRVLAEQEILVFITQESNL